MTLKKGNKLGQKGNTVTCKCKSNSLRGIDMGTENPAIRKNREVLIRAQRLAALRINRSYRMVVVWKLWCFPVSLLRIS